MERVIKNGTYEIVNAELPSSHRVLITSHGGSYMMAIITGKRYGNLICYTTEWEIGNGTDKTVFKNYSEAHGAYMYGN